MIVVGRVIPSLIDSLPRQSLPDIVIFLFLILTPVGVILLIGFGLVTLIGRNDIRRFLSIERIVVSDRGIALYKKDESTDLVIGWQQIKTIQLRYLKHMLLGLMEARREPVAIEFNLIDGSKFRIPLGMILKEKDQLRMVSTINRYVSFKNGMAQQAG
jgi:hypothetical protein